MATSSGSGKIARFDPAVYREVTELRSLLRQTHKVIDTLEELVRPRGYVWLPWRHHTLREKIEQARHELEDLKLALVKELITAQSSEVERLKNKRNVSAMHAPRHASRPGDARKTPRG